MSKALEAARKAREENGINHKTPLEKFQDNPTRKTAINAFCWEVCYCSGADKGVRWMIGNCNIPTCPLYPFRPYQNFVGKPKPKGIS